MLGLIKFCLLAQRFMTPTDGHDKNLISPVVHAGGGFESQVTQSVHRFSHIFRKRKTSEQRKQTTEHKDWYSNNAFGVDRTNCQEKTHNDTHWGFLTAWDSRPLTRIEVLQPPIVFLWRRGCRARQKTVHKDASG